MAKQPSQPRAHLSAEEKRMRQWRACGVVTLVAVLVLVAFAVALKFFHDDEHPHNPAPHGGVVVSVAKGDDHYHVEAFVEKGGTLKLYTFGEEVDKLQQVESQVLAARVKRKADTEFLSVDLMPRPSPSDPEGRTSQFFGRLPHRLRGSPLAVRIAGIEIDGKRFALEFAVPASPHDGDADEHARDEEKLYLSAGGKYTEADIAENRRQTASARYTGLRAEHNMKLNRGDRVCPITRIKANREFTWVVSGKTYEFCCPPCIDEFVRLAKEEPEAIAAPDKYTKK